MQPSRVCLCPPPVHFGVHVVMHRSLLAPRQRQLEELQVLALQFHESLEPLGEWLGTTERRLSSAEPMGTQTAKITQQIAKHKVEFRLSRSYPKKILLQDT